mmetsp:Transcript_10617/g.16810  ORF Transcript_10617/g.16810 Transcript_10617/m.16810 type:complete len:203 (-) Transcript_10617:98-706(-)
MSVTETAGVSLSSRSNPAAEQPTTDTPTFHGLPPVVANVRKRHGNTRPSPCCAYCEEKNMMASDGTVGSPSALIGQLTIAAATAWSMASCSCSDCPMPVPMTISVSATRADLALTGNMRWLPLTTTGSSASRRVISPISSSLPRAASVDRPCARARVSSPQAGVFSLWAAHRGRGDVSFPTSDLCDPTDEALSGANACSGTT